MSVLCTYKWGSFQGGGRWANPHHSCLRHSTITALSFLFLHPEHFIATSFTCCQCKRGMHYRSGRIKWRLSDESWYIFLYLWGKKLERCIQTHVVHFYFFIPEGHPLHISTHTHTHTHAQILHFYLSEDLLRYNVLSSPLR